MNKIKTPLILSILYFVLITPLGLVMRVFGSDPLTQKVGNSVYTYRVESRAAEAGDQRRDDQKYDNLERPF